MAYLNWARLLGGHLLLLDKTGESVADGQLKPVLKVVHVKGLRHVTRGAREHVVIARGGVEKGEHRTTHIPKSKVVQISPIRRSRESSSERERVQVRERVQERLGLMHCAWSVPTRMTGRKLREVQREVQRERESKLTIQKRKG
jgi:hypothetical protein